MSYEELMLRLAAIGVDESYKGVANKINRRTFSFVFFIQCMKTLGRERNSTVSRLCIKN